MSWQLGAQHGGFDMKTLPAPQTQFLGCIIWKPVELLGGKAQLEETGQGMDL